MRVFIIGAGVVCSSIGKSLHDRGMDIIFVDIVPVIIKNLSREGYTAIPPSKMYNYSADVSINTVPTPMNMDGSVDLLYITLAVSRLGKWMKKCGSKNHLVIIRSTILHHK